MALFSSKNSKKEVVAETKPAVQNASHKNSSQDLSQVLLTPRVTEKATAVMEKGAYVFNVHPTANKRAIAAAVTKFYNVIPTKVSVVRIRGKEVFSRGKWGKKAGGKKAYIYVKKGDKIDII